jgi:hypothetical protein
MHTIKGNSDFSSVSNVEKSFLIPVLNACVSYERTVVTVNNEGNNSKAVTPKTIRRATFLYPVEIYCKIIYVE